MARSTSNKKALSGLKGLRLPPRQTYLPDNQRELAPCHPRAGCCGILGPDPSTTLDKQKCNSTFIKANCQERMCRSEILGSCPMSNMSLNTETTLSRGREVRRRRCVGIVDDERQRDPPKLSPSWGVAGEMACLFCCSSSPIPTIYLLSYLKSGTVSPATNGMLFMGQETLAAYGHSRVLPFWL